MSVSLRTKRGLLSAIPTLAAGELYYATDTNGFYVGHGGDNHLINCLPTGYIDGLPLAFLALDNMTVGPGEARDDTDAVDLVLDTAVTVDRDTVGALGTAAKALTGTVAYTNTGNTLTGTGTAFLTEFGGRAGTGTITGAGTTITGTGTKFLSEFSLGDLIGTAAVGYSRITAIANDTSLTVVAAMPGGSAGGTTPRCIENALVEAGSQLSRRVNTIASNTSLVVETAWTATASGQAAVAGWGNEVGGVCDQFLWLAYGASGTTVYISSQRTTPFALTGYDEAVRRIGSLIYYDPDVTFIPFTAERQGPAISYIYVFPANSYGNRIVSGAGASAAWTRVSARACVPATAGELLLGAFLVNPVGAVSVNLRAASVDNYAGLTSPHRTNAETGGRSGGQFHVGCDGAQCFDWTINVADANNPVTIEVGGYSEVL